MQQFVKDPAVPYWSCQDPPQASAAGVVVRSELRKYCLGTAHLQLHRSDSAQKTAKRKTRGKLRDEGSTRCWSLQSLGRLGVSS